MMEMLGYATEPASDAVRHDIIQMIHFGAPDPVIKFCKGIQMGAPVDSYVTPVPWDMPRHPGLALAHQISPLLLASLSGKEKA